MAAVPIRRPARGNEARAALAGPGDWVIAAAMLLLLAGAARWALDRPGPGAPAAALIAGAAAERAIGRRLVLYGAEGVLAAEALCEPDRWRYWLGWHLAVLALAGGVALLGRPMAAPFVVPAYAAGSAAALCLERLSLALPWPRARRWPVRRWAATPGGAAMAGALVAPTTMLLASHAQAAPASGVIALIGAMALTTPDHGIVRFMAACGFGAGRSVARYARPGWPFAAAAAVVAWPVLGAAAGGAVVAGIMGALALTAARVLLYRLHDRRGAELLLAAGAGVLVAAAWLAPPALPIVAGAAGWRLARGSAARTWLLA